MDDDPPDTAAPCPPPPLPPLLLLASGSTPMAAHMRANWARNVGFERMSLACVCANCCSSERNTASCVSRACALVERSVEPWLAYCADVSRERSKAARPTPFRDILFFFWVGRGRVCVGAGVLSGSEGRFVGVWELVL